MSEEQKQAEENIEEEINPLDYVIVLAKRKNLILKITLSVAVISFILTIPKTSFYEAQTSILPPQQENISMGNQFMRDFGIFPLRGGTTQNRQELLVEIIKSRTFSDRIIKRFGLKELYGKKDEDGAREMLFNNITIQPDFTVGGGSLKGGALSPLTRISVRNNNPERAANIANAIVEELNFSLNNLTITEASQKRLFLEVQLKQAYDALIKTEDDLKMFQQKTGLLKVETQTTMTIEKIANMQAQITAKEVELELMKSYSTASNPDFQRVEETIEVLKKELAKLEVNKTNSKNLLIPTGTIPALGLEYQRKFRELKFNENLYDILVKQYEMAKIDEAKNAPLIQVIDKAVPPYKKKTTRKFGGTKALMATLSAFLFSCFLAFVMEFRERSSKRPNERIETLKKYLSIRKKT
jgi:uncharacterized protein involved in exopolysaccharide biosynthesis